MLDFVGIGAQKAGTTWLFENLSRHPGIRFPGGKEVHFWDVHFANGIDWYKNLFSSNLAKVLSGEITPAYAILATNVIRQFKNIFPDVRIIFVIRNPLRRAWSSALMALRRAEMIFDEASDQWFIDHFKSKNSLLRGDYATCIENWQSVFPPEQMLIMQFEHIQTDPAGFLKSCCRHIGAEPSVLDSIPLEVLYRSVFSGPHFPLRPSLLPILHDIYFPKIKKLEDTLQRDFSDWLNI
jgi:hypothetical protein